MGKTRLGSVIVASALFACGCGANGIGGTGGSTGTGGTPTGGTTGTGGNSTGGTTGTGGSTGGVTGTGGITGTGGQHTGGTTGTGGSTGTGGTATGGTTGTGGATSTGGMAGHGTGGSSATGGTTGTGGSATGGVGGASSGVTVQTTQTEQKIEGFGINDNWAAGSTPASLFTTSGSGIGLTILRTGMSDSTGSSSGQFYNSGEISGDVATLKAGAGADAKLIGSVWSPPTAARPRTRSTRRTTDGLDGGHLMVSAIAAPPRGRTPSPASPPRTASTPCRSGTSPTSTRAVRTIPAMARIRRPS